MPKLAPLEELEIAIRLSAKDAPSTLPSHAVARDFYESNRKLIAVVADEWIIEKLASLIAKHRAKARRENNPQMVLEGLLGFTHLPRKLRDSNGSLIPRSDATITVLRKYAIVLRKNKSPGLEETERAIKLMSAYTYGGSRITWGEVVEREAKKKGEVRARGNR